MDAGRRNESPGEPRPDSVLPSEPPAAPAADYPELRRRMVRQQLDRRGRDISDPRVLRAMARVPRHRFVPPALEEEAYGDHPLPIGHGQTISQPFIVALMTQALDPQPDDRCLEIGTGSAYQTAVLASLVQWVFSLEIIPELFHRAQATLRSQHIDNISLRLGDGHRGWPEQAPFNSILVACAAPSIPSALFDQLADHGRMVVPVGEKDGNQELLLIERQGNRWLRTCLLPVRFVPMTGNGSPEYPGL